MNFVNGTLVELGILKDDFGYHCVRASINVTWYSFGTQWHGIPVRATIETYQLYAFHQVIRAFVATCPGVPADDNVWSPGKVASGPDSVARSELSKRRREPSIGFLARLRTSDSCSRTSAL